MTGNLSTSQLSANGDARCYDLHGLGVQSEIPMPRLCLRPGPPDVVIRFGRVDRKGLTGESSRSRYCAEPGRIRIEWPGAGAFEIMEGRRIAVDPVSDAGAELLGLFVQGAAFALLMHQRGMIVLHASAVTLRGEACAFVGVKGSGKSTLSAALVQRGCTLVTDDIAVIDIAGESALVRPGIGHIKLWPGALRSIGEDPSDHPRLCESTEKRVFVPAGPSLCEPVPLARIYALEPGERCAIEPVQDSQALIEILPHWYAARYGARMMRPLGIDRHFLECALLARSVAVHRTFRRPEIESFEVLADLICEQTCETEAIG